MKNHAVKNSFMQTEAWIDFQRRLKRKIFEYNQDGIKTYIIRRDIAFGKNYLYIPYGPEMDLNSMKGGLKNPVNNFIGFLKRTAKKQKSIFIRIEPVFDNIAQILAESGFKKSKREIQPSKTVIVDLSKDKSDLIKAMHHKTRYNIKVAEKHGISVGKSDNHKNFLELIKKTSKRDKFSIHPEKYYDNLLNFFSDNKEIKTSLFVAKYKDIPVAAAIILCYRNAAYYLHGASDYEYRKYMAPYALHWHIVSYLKETGFLSYDLWGINNRKYPGVTRFKLGWGGKTVEKPGAFDLTVSKFWRLLYKIASRS